MSDPKTKRLDKLPEPDARRWNNFADGSSVRPSVIPGKWAAYDADGRCVCGANVDDAHPPADTPEAAAAHLGYSIGPAASGEGGGRKDDGPDLGRLTYQTYHGGTVPVAWEKLPPEVRARWDAASSVVAKAATDSREAEHFATAERLRTDLAEARRERDAAHAALDGTIYAGRLEDRIKALVGEVCLLRSRLKAAKEAETGPVISPAIFPQTDSALAVLLLAVRERLGGSPASCRSEAPCQ